EPLPCHRPQGRPGRAASAGGDVGRDRVQRRSRRAGA
ncbi:MAG: Phosphoribosylformimino-5-aminoimidazole carboxamide ribotide isomerase, partial [uncultured Rubellimicrobium sp.]